jgi:hypothetical protein
VGGTESIQRRFFIPAKADYSDRATFDELSIEDLRIRKYTVKQFLDWAFSGDGYMQIAHPLQENDLPWDFIEFQTLLEVYANDFVIRKGGKLFPRLPTQLGCNILLQNKFGYISSVSDMFIPSFKLERTESGELNEATKGALWDFLTSYYEFQRDNYMGTYVFKAPYTTASKGIAWPKTFTEVLDQFKSWCLNAAFDNKPYFIVQPRLANRQVSFNELFDHIIIILLITTCGIYHSHCLEHKLN